MTPPPWLPALVTLADHGGDPDAYLAALYGFFTADFITTRPRFRGETLALKRHPMSRGKEATFWHVISEGATEDERLLDMRRCERIRWPRPVIEHEAEPVVRVWKNQRGCDERICLWLEAAEYLIVLARREKYLLLWTAYPVIEPHRKRKLQREYDEASK
jgi:hypothetical protein